MNNIQTFEHDEFGKVRTLLIDNEPWFVGKDVAEILGYSNTKDALITHVDEDDRRIIQRSENTTLEIPNRGLTVINESGLYSLILSSKLPNAKKFKRWVTSEVLPAIRKRGFYGAPKTTAEQIQLLAQGNVELTQKIEKVESDLQEFKDDMPLLTIECETISRAAKKKGVEVLGGKQSEAYRDKSLRGRVYGDIYRELKRQFNVNSYKAIRRRDCKKAVGIVESYKLPVFLEEQVNDSNAQMRLNDK